MKSLQRVPMPMTRSASSAIRLAASVPVAPIAPSDCGWSKGSETLPAWLSPTGMPVARQLFERSAGVAVDDAAAGDHQRPLGAADELGGARDQLRLGRRARHPPDPLLEQPARVVVRLRLDVLRQAQRDRAGLGWRGEDAHRLGQRGDQLLGPIDPVPVARHRPEAVVHRDVLAVLGLELLQHGGDVAPREDVSRQQQDRQPVDGGAGGRGQHVGGARANRCGARQGGETVLHPRVGRRGVHHRLFVAALVVAELRGLLQRLTDPGDVAVPEDAEAAGEQRLLDAVALARLAGQEPDQRLRHRESRPAHAANQRDSASRSAPPASSSAATAWSTVQPRWMIPLTARATASGSTSPG